MTFCRELDSQEVEEIGRIFTRTCPVALRICPVCSSSMVLFILSSFFLMYRSRGHETCRVSIKSAMIHYLFLIDLSNFFIQTGNETCRVSVKLAMICYLFPRNWPGIMASFSFDLSSFDVLTRVL